MSDSKENITEEDKKKLEEVCKNIVDNFPMEKYQKLVEALKEVMTHPNMKGAVIKYLEETNK